MSVYCILVETEPLYKLELCAYAALHICGLCWLEGSVNVMLRIWPPQVAWVLSCYLPVVFSIVLPSRTLG